MELKMEGLIITVYLKGKIKGPVSNAATKEQISNIKGSPFEKIHRGEKGLISFITPKNHVSFPENAKLRGFERCSIKHIISSKTLKSWMSGDCPYWVSKRKWEKMDKNERVASFISRYDDGFGLDVQSL